MMMLWLAYYCPPQNRLLSESLQVTWCVMQPKHTMNKVESHCFYQRENVTTYPQNYFSSNIFKNSLTIRLSSSLKRQADTAMLPQNVLETLCWVVPDFLLMRAMRLIPRYVDVLAIRSFQVSYSCKRRDLCHGCKKYVFPYSALFLSTTAAIVTVFILMLRLLFFVNMTPLYGHWSRAAA